MLALTVPASASQERTGRLEWVSVHVAALVNRRPLYVDAKKCPRGHKCPTFLSPPILCSSGQYQASVEKSECDTVTTATSQDQFVTRNGQLANAHRGATLTKTAQIDTVWLAQLALIAAYTKVGMTYKAYLHYQIGTATRLLRGISFAVVLEVCALGLLWQPNVPVTTMAPTVSFA